MFKNQQDKDKYSHVLTNINDKLQHFHNCESKIVTLDTLRDTIKRLFDLYRLADGELQMMVHRGELTVEEYMNDIMSTVAWNHRDTVVDLKRSAIVNSNLSEEIKILISDGDGIL